MRKIAILHADETPTACLDITTIENLYMNCFSEINIAIEFFDVKNHHYPSNADKSIDAYLITGSKFCVNDDLKWIMSLKNFIITNQNRKFIGICFGHQLIASALGGKVVKSSAGWNMGVKKIDILSKERWMTPFAQNLNVIFNHQDEVIQVPKGAKILAKDYHHPILMYSISNRILSMQFHPEFTPLYQKTLMYNKKSEINPVVIKNAELSYKTPVDLVINTWIKNFINAKV